MMKNIYEPTESEKKEYFAYESPVHFYENLEDGLASLEQLAEQENQYGKTLICGGMAAFDREIINFLNEINKNHKNLFLLSEVTAQFRRYTEDKVEFPYVCTPHLLAKEIIVLGMEIDVRPEMEQLVSEKKYIQEAIINLENRHNRLGDGYAKVWAFYAYRYINKLLDFLQPSEVVLWNAFYAFHHIFKEVSKERGIALKYMEFGCIPGTLCLEEIGQQGESVPARNYIKFRRKRVNRHELEEAKKKLQYLKMTGLNRNIQPTIKLLPNMFSYYRQGNKLVIYMGQNDYESGLCPYTATTQQYHSPIFKSTLECLEYLRLLVIKNSWNLVFKPHPIMAALGHDCIDAESKEQIDVITDADINSLIDCASLIVTILSQSAYIALIREKPVLMLGYIQLRGKGCTYEAFLKTKIEKQMKKALKFGYTKRQKRNFHIHTAQLLKYYLIDDGIERELQICKNKAAGIWGKSRRSFDY